FHLVTSPVLAVGLGDHQLVVLVEADVDGAAIGLAHLDLPGRAVLGVAFDRVGVTAGVELERRGLCLVGAWSVGSAPVLSSVADRDRRARASRREGENRAADDRSPA